MMLDTWPTLPDETLSFLDELGYNTVALSYVLSGKMAGDLSCQIPNPLPFETPRKLQVLRRCTVIISDASQNFRLPELTANYDILALRPTDEQSLRKACESLECDIISLDLTARLDAPLKMKTLGLAIERGIKFEICYAPGLLSSNDRARTNLISNATQLIRATRGRGLILSSEAHRALSCRAPADVINLAAVWGLGPEKGKDALDKLARHTVASAQLRRNSYRGAIDIIARSSEPLLNGQGNAKNTSNATKRKLEVSEDLQAQEEVETPQLSKRAQKRLKKTGRAPDAESNPGVVKES